MADHPVVRDSGETTAYHPAHDTAEQTQAANLIGRDGAPVRALAFGSGAFDTSLQLGVIHALLVSQARPPDVVVGTSAGAIHAVALAEVLQAGDEEEREAASLASVPEPEDVIYRRRLEARVRRFRQIFDGLLAAPDKLIGATRPDTTQIEAQRPLEPLKLPIHDQHEWDGRHTSLRARAGFINLYNKALALRVSIGTLTRAIRRFLGIRAAVETRSPLARTLTLASEAARSWLMLGVNLPQLAPLLRTLVWPLVRHRLPEDRGSTAGDLIFQSRFWNRVGRAMVVAISFVLLAHAWASVSLLFLAALGLIPHLLRIAWAAATSRPMPEFDAQLFGWSILGVYLILIAAGSTYDLVKRRNLFAFRVFWAEALTLLFLSGSAALTIWALWALAFLFPLPADRPLAWHDAALAMKAALPNLLQTVGITVVLLAVLLLLILFGQRRKYTRNFLAQFDIADGLFPKHPLRQLFVSLFDPRYYGNLDMDDVVERALRDDLSPTQQSSTPKTIGQYSSRKRKPPIEVGLTVADVATGHLELLGPDVNVVDGLLAANAMAPLFAPASIGDKLYIDGGNIAHEPTRPLLDLLRKRVNPNSTIVHLYSVSSLRFSQESLPTRRKFSNLVDVVWRAFQLQRFRDATLGRRVTELFTQVIPKEAGVRYRAGDKWYLRTRVNPIEPEAAPDLTRQLLSTSDREERRALMARTVADGCRAALETMIRPSLVPPGGPAAVTVPCRVAVARHLAAHSPFIDLPKPITDLPGSSTDPRSGPGVIEICSHCRLRDPDCESGVAGTGQRVTLRVRDPKAPGPAWPHECEPDKPDITSEWRVPDKAPPDEYDAKTGQALREIGKANRRPGMTDEKRWPRARNELAGLERPLVSLLFSGGVFRGVHQMGVLNALSEVDLKPDIIAGASVGSITAALVAHTFMANTPEARRPSVARLAATYLALDRLILTDRFADSIRTLTLRSAATRFSLRQADGFFRRYDSASPGTFDAEARLVVAGLERLLYLSPFELKALVKALRDQEPREVLRLVRRYLVEWLDRMGVGTEVLGAEPLSLIISEHILKPILGDKNLAPSSVPFDVFLDKAGIYFLATVTNLTQGRLEVLGEQHTRHTEDRRASLLEGLLASSAFPGVFRPRRAYEVMPMTRAEDLYIDGGVMDNLPLDAVAHFLFRASQERLITARPVVGNVPTPHLLFSASLEANPPCLTTEQRDELCNDWPALWRRARTLGYNKKLDTYTTVQRAVRAIYETSEQERADDTPRTRELHPLDLEVVTVRPNWLCGTFAFHPMLGFRRKRQAESIAHGCASTLLELGKLRTEPDAQRWLSGWGIDEDRLPSAEQSTRQDKFRGRDAHNGECWFREGRMCPFSREALRELNLKPQTASELAQIHRLCGRPETHQPRNGG